MNENKKKELMEKLTTREVVDTYEDNKNKRRIIYLIILILLIGCIVIFNKKKNEKAEKNAYETCKLDDCKNYKKEFIEEIRYGSVVFSKNNTYFNCAKTSKDVDKINDTCYGNENNKKCEKYSIEKNYCYAFTKDNIEKETKLYVSNPKYISNIKDLKSLETLYINVNSKYSDLSKLFEDIKKLSNSNDSLKIYVYVEEISETNIKNTSNTDEKEYKNINICMFDKELCDDYDKYVSLNDAVNIINNFKSVSKELNNKFKNPSDIEKIVFVYSYILENYNIDEKSAKEEAELSTKNKETIAAKKEILYLIENKIGSHYALSSYLNALLNYLGVNSVMVASSDLKNKVHHEYNQIKIDSKWYNTDIALDIANKSKGTDTFEYFLKSDDDFNHSDYKNDVEANKCSSTYSVEKINSIVSKLK